MLTHPKSHHVILIILSLLSSFFLLKMAKAAEQFPVKPISYIVPTEAGSDGDILARPISQKVSAILGQPVVVVNKPGAGSTLGYLEVYRAKPDGYTIGVSFATIVSNKLQGILPYDYRDFTVLGTYATYTPVIVASTKTQRPFKTIQEVIAFAKSQPGEVSIATSGVGYAWWIATMAFQEGTRLKFNIIPQAGSGAFTVAQVSGGHVDLGIIALGVARPQIEAGNLRCLAVFGSKRVPAPFDNVPSLKDAGYDIFWESTQTVIGPPKMPNEIAEKIAKAFERAGNDPEYQKFVIEKNAVPFVSNPEKAVEFLSKQREVCRSVMEKAGILKEK